MSAIALQIVATDVDRLILHMHSGLHDAQDHSLRPKPMTPTRFVTLASLLLFVQVSDVHAEKIRYICSGTHVEYDGWGKRVEQMSSLKEDPVDLVIDTTAKKIRFSTLYGGPVEAELKESAQWFEGQATLNKPVMNGTIATVSVKADRYIWGAHTIYTLANGENHLAYAGVCTPKVID